MRRLRPTVERQLAEMKQAINRTFLFGEPRPLTASERKQLRERQLAEMKRTINRTLLFGERYPHFRDRKQSTAYERPAHVWKW